MPIRIKSSKYEIEIDDGEGGFLGTSNGVEPEMTERNKDNGDGFVTDESEITEDGVQVDRDASSVEELDEDKIVVIRRRPRRNRSRETVEYPTSSGRQGSIRVARATTKAAEKNPSPPRRSEKGDRSHPRTRPVLVQNKQGGGSGRDAQDRRPSTDIQRDDRGARRARQQDQRSLDIVEQATLPQPAKRPNQRVEEQAAKVSSRQKAWQRPRQPKAPLFSWGSSW